MSTPPPIHPPRAVADQVEILGRETCYQGFFRIDRYRLRHRLAEGGWSAPVLRETFERGHAAAILPYDPVLDRVVLVEQIRMAPLAAGEDPWMLEIPAGMIEAGESAAEVAVRECLEETGLNADGLIPIHSYYPSPGAATERIDLFCGRVDAAAPPARAGLSEEGEDIRVVPVAWAQAQALLTAGRINNAATLIALLWLAPRRDALRAQWEMAS